MSGLPNTSGDYFQLLVTLSDFRAEICLLGKDSDPIFFASLIKNISPIFEAKGIVK